MGQHYHYKYYLFLLVTEENRLEHSLSDQDINVSSYPSNIVRMCLCLCVMGFLPIKKTMSYKFKFLIGLYYCSRPSLVFFFFFFFFFYHLNPFF